MLSRFTPVLRTFAWLGLAAAQIFDYMIIHTTVMKLAQLWYDGAYTSLMAADPRNSTDQIDFVLKAVYFTTMVVLGIIFVSSAIYMEHYFEQGEKKKILLKRIGIVAGIEVGIYLIFFLLSLGLGLLG